MKILIYVNKEKDYNLTCYNELTALLLKNNIEFLLINDENLNDKISADVLFSIGGDGTILALTDFAIKNDLAIIGINAGKLGFLCEFEKNEISEIVKALLNDELVEDVRELIKITYKDKTFFALNDVYVQRTGNVAGALFHELCFEIDGELIAKYSCDGAIISTSTGSTAYSFSLGGPLVAPNMSILLFAPIAPHSFNNRQIVFSSGSVCKMYSTKNVSAGLFVDGKYVCNIEKDVEILVTKADTRIKFLRRKNGNFFTRLTKKMNKDYNI